MPVDQKPLRFDAIRPWDGTQSRAFEELSYQLLKDDVPTGTRAIRTAAPDGGVEWYATMKDRSECGWQAKFIRDFDVLLGAMTGSVRRVALERPQLRKLIFVISINLATGTTGRQRLSQRQRFDNKVATWKREIRGAENIEFDLVQESDLLDKLALPEHRARVWFWWGQPSFDPSWLDARHKEQGVAAGEKYRPDLQVDVPIQEDLEALGFDASVLGKYETKTRRIQDAVSDWRFRQVEHGGLAVALDRAKKAADSLSRTLQTTLAVDGAPDVLDAVENALRTCVDAIAAAEEIEYALHSEWASLPESTPDRDQLKPPDEARGYRVRRLRDLCYELQEWLGSTLGRALRDGLYFLLGPAGSGKTHLLLDSVKRSLVANRPGVFLAGGRFGRADLWASVCDQLGLSPIGTDLLLGAMDSAGEASSLRGNRFVICVDALNETPGSDFWRVHLPILRAAVAQWDHVGLVVSCRDTYADIVDDGTERNHYVRRVHPGFAGREVEATQRYFSHYGLESPRIPLLTPEFTVPLFLRLYCESLHEAGETAPAAGHEGRIRIFDRYLAAKISSVARRIRPNISTAFELESAQRLTRDAVEKLLDELVDRGRESMPVSRAEQLLMEIAEAADVPAILGHLQSEGILTRELLYLEDSEQEGIRIVFQAFSDYLILKQRMRRGKSPIHEDGDFKSWLWDEASWGILEAAAVTFPELEGIELPDFLDLSRNDLVAPGGEDQDAWRRYRRTEHVYESLVETLPYREASAITQSTIDHLNHMLQAGRLRGDRFFQILFTISPQPNNRLNGAGLHRYLSKFKMPKRDHWFGISTYYELWEESSPASRLAQWAAGGPYPTYDREVIELSTIPLLWLCSSPNRYMRDWVTKALVRLLSGHLDVVTTLVRRFWAVDDPYVVQRMIVITYAALIWGGTQDRENARAVVSEVLKLVFTRPMRADELMLDAARGIVEWGVKNDLLDKLSARTAERPYGFTIPGAPPTESSLKTKYGYKENQSDDRSYSSLWFSLMSLGDFGRYVVESGMNHFSRYRLGEEFPKRDNAEPRFVKSKWKAFEKSLSDEQKAQLEEITRERGDAHFARWTSGQSIDLTQEQWDLLAASWRYPKSRIRDDQYPGSRARRWVFRRTLSLGWTPELFGNQDRRIGHGNGREGHKEERWGKKYQWIAYHELLAKVADNYQPSRMYSDSGPYEGLYQLTGDREIDPTLPPVPFQLFVERGTDEGATWTVPPIHFPDWPPAKISFAQYQNNLDLFIDDVASEPSLRDVLVVKDSEEHDWVVLDAYIQQTDPQAAKGWRGLRQVLGVDTWFAADKSSPQLLKMLQKLRSRGHDLIDTHGHTDCCYFGEIGWVDRACYYRHAEWREYGDSNVIRLVATAESYAWEGSILDCSIEQTAFASLPSTFIQERASLRPRVDGPSWETDSGEVVFVNRQVNDNDNDRALLVKADWLSTFLQRHHLVLVASGWFERRHLDSERPRGRTYKSGSLAASLDHLGTIKEARAFSENA
jgi:hypothetical protein